MTLIARASRLFRADLHAILDRLEEPDLILHQAIREMEEDLAADRRRLDLLRSDGAQLAARDAELARALAVIEEELDVCFEAGQDDLARTLLRRRLEAEALRAGLARKREALEGRTKRLEQRVQEHAAQLEAMRQKAELLLLDEDAPSATGFREAGEARVRDEDVEVAFLREQQRRQRR